MEVRDFRCLSLYNRYLFVLDARRVRKERWATRKIKNEAIIEAAQHRRLMRIRIMKKANRN